MPPGKARQARYCSDTCTEKARYERDKKNPRRFHKTRRLTDEKLAERQKVNARKSYWTSMNLPTDDAERRGIIMGYRSGLEAKVAQELKDAGVEPRYESETIKYQVPQRTASYKPDFVIYRQDGSKFYVETKGRFIDRDRVKHLHIKDSRPDIEIRFVFQTPTAKLSKTSKTTYADWAEKHGFQWAKRSIPADWLKE